MEAPLLPAILSRPCNKPLRTWHEDWCSSGCAPSPPRQEQQGWAGNLHPGGAHHPLRACELIHSTNICQVPSTCSKLWGCPGGRERQVPATELTFKQGKQTVKKSTKTGKNFDMTSNLRRKSVIWSSNIGQRVLPEMGIRESLSAGGTLEARPEWGIWVCWRTKGVSCSQKGMSHRKGSIEVQRVGRVRPL